LRIGFCFGINFSNQPLPKTNSSIEFWVPMRKLLIAVFKSLVCLTLLILYSNPIWAEEKKNKTFDTFTFYWENDLFADTDRDYTNGFKFTWSTPFLTNREESRLPGWSYPVLNLLPFVKDPTSSRAVSISLGQNIFTAEDTEVKELIVDQRPYAGYLYLAFGFHSKKGNRKDTWEIALGVVGPNSLAKQAQNLVHDITGSDRTEGWDNQLENEPTLEIICESKWRLLHSELGRGFRYDVIPHLGGGVGNVAIYANTGAELRFGWNLPENFGSCPIRPGCETSAAYDIPQDGNSRRSRIGAHLFTGVNGMAVLHNIFLDGNNFRDSHSVDKKTFVADLMAGFVISYERYKVSYSYVYRTKEYKTQSDPQVFGSIQFSFSY
jgi:lipid A 3-O-deacylase